MEAELGKIGSMLKSIAPAMRELAIVVSPPAHRRFAAFQNPIAPVSNSILALAAAVLCAVAIGLLLSSRAAQKSRAARNRNRPRVGDASKASLRTRIQPRGPNPVLRLAPGRRGKT